MRGIEDRAHREVERIPEDGKAVAIQCKALGRQVEQLQRRLEATQVDDARVGATRTLQTISDNKASGGRKCSALHQ